MDQVSIMSAHNTDPSLRGDVSIVDFILTVDFPVCSPSGYIISGKEETVLFRLG